MSVNLNFSLPATTGNDLVFGEDIVVIPDASFALSAALHGLSGADISLRLDAYFSLTAQLQGLSSANVHIAPGYRYAIAIPSLQMLSSATVGVMYDSQTERPTIAQATTSSQPATPVEWGITQPEKISQPYSSGAESWFTETVKISDSTLAHYQEATKSRTRSFSRFTESYRLSATDRIYIWQDGTPKRIQHHGLFQDATQLTATRLKGQFEDGLKDRRITVKSRAQVAIKRMPYSRQDSATSASRLSAMRRAEFEDAQRPNAGISPSPIIPIVPPEYWGTELLFQCPPLEHAYLVFGARPCYPEHVSDALLYILPARYYMTAHTIHAQRLPDLTDIPIFGATVSADIGSYCWSLSATGPADLFAMLSPVDGLPAQLKITLDGMVFVFAIDGISRNASFGKTGATIKGRSVTSLIAEPYKIGTAYNNIIDQTAQQIAIGILTPEGIDLDWGIGSGALANGGLTDWLVPSGAFSHHSNPLFAVNAIAQSVGGYLQSHRSLATLMTRHPYGTRTGDISGAPWDWMTGNADIELATDSLITESIDRKDGADLNAVYVSGATQGILALVKRTGTASDKLGNMITDPLITHTDAARQRGLAILGASGHKYNVTLELPVLTGTNQPGIIDVGNLIQVNTSTPWRGRVQSVSVSAKQPTLRQTITIERHIA